jgi:DNA-binding GntR family transcriptional regulator
MNDPDLTLIIQRGETLAEQAYARLRGALASGVFKPGESLSIRGLARLLGVSATPARDAIARALWDRSLEGGPNRTVVVPELTLASVHDIYSIRMSLEGLATQLAAPNFDAPALIELKAVLDAYCAAIDAQDRNGMLETNERFHFLIYRQSGNELLVEMISSLWLKMGPSLNFLFPAYLDKRGIKHKVSILEALRSRQGAKARAALEADLTDGRQQIEQALESAGSDSTKPKGEPVAKPRRSASRAR